ncbi:exo-alpha-sialidase [Trypanosoma cruzi]|nr:exo-alpha-sialidase [Trypanosoma cruzi]
MCVWAVCVLLVLSEPSNFTVAISACFPSVCVQQVEETATAAIHQTRQWGAEQSTHAESRRQDNPEGTARRTIAHRKEQQHGNSRQAVGVCAPALTRCNTPHPTAKDRQTGGGRWMPSGGNYDQNGP